MDHQEPAWLKPSRYIQFATSVLVLLIAMWFAHGFSRWIQCVYEFMLPGPYHDLSLIHCWPWLLIIVAVMLCIGLYAVHTTKHLLFYVLCNVTRLAAVWFLVFPTSWVSSNLVTEISRYNFHQAQWTGSYLREKLELPEEAFVSFAYPTVFDEMWHSYRRSRGLREDAPPPELFTPKKESGSEECPRTEVEPNAPAP